MTCEVLATGPTGKSMPVRGLLDSGADISAITSKVAKHLCLEKLDTTISVSTYGDVVNETACPTVSLTIDSIHSKPWRAQIAAVVTYRITGNLPRQSAASLRKLPCLQGVQLADPNFDVLGRIDLLLGIDILLQILMLDGPEESMGTWQTRVVGTVMGTYDDDSLTGTSQASVQVVREKTPDSKQEHDDSALTRFWEVEQPTKQLAVFSQEEIRIQEQYAATHVFLPQEGKYQVHLPKNDRGLILGDSRARALHRFETNERSLIRKGDWEKFQLVVQEYMDLNHAQPVTPQELKTPTPLTYYLPMHGVHKEGSSTTKLRVVFDASAPSTTTVSLNDTLAVGPTLHPTLDSILLKFRMHRVALTGDIKGMYREILLSPPDNCTGFSGGLPWTSQSQSTG